MEVKKKLIEVALLEGHDEKVWCVAWSPHGKMIASCSSDQTVRIWSRGVTAADWKCVDVLDDGHTRTIRSVSWSPSGIAIATCSFDGTGFQNVAVLEGHDNEVKCVSWSPSGGLLATCGRDKSVWVWEAAEVDEEDEKFECICICTEHTQDVKYIVWGSEEEQLFSASYDNTIKVWQEHSDDWVCAHTLNGHTSTVWALDVEPSPIEVISCSDDKSIIIWKYFKDVMGTAGRSSAWKKVAVIPEHAQRSIYSVSWSAYSGAIVTGAGDNAIRIIEQTYYKETWIKTAEKKEAHSGDVNCVKWSPVSETKGKQLLASCGDDCNVRVWSYCSSVS
eukprot:GSMAST32.ASY1.ANO1.1115.1 assembled CDS